MDRPLSYYPLSNVQIMLTIVLTSKLSIISEESINNKHHVMLEMFLGGGSEACSHSGGRQDGGSYICSP